MNNYKYSDVVYSYMMNEPLGNDLLHDMIIKTSKISDDINDNWCMYFWIPQDIHMKKGKLAGQVAHAAARLARMMGVVDWDNYLNNEVKIVYKVTTTSAMVRVMDELLTQYPVEYHTLVFDNTWEKHTVFGIATKKNLKNKKWKLA